MGHANVLHPSRLKQRKLERKQARRRQRKLKRRLAERRHSELLDRRFGRRSRILTMLAAGSRSESASQKKRSCRLVLPPVFSLLDAPEGTLRCLREFAAATVSQRPKSVDIDYSRVTQQDLGANALLDIIVDELSTQARRTGRKLRWRGTYPKDPALKRFVRAMGVIKRLRIEHEYADTKDVAQLKLFDKRSKHYVATLKGHQRDRKSSVTGQLADHINECLRTIGKELTPMARLQLCSYVGEILGNAEEHAGMTDWTIQGYLDTQVAAPMCEITIFNFGDSIAHTLSALAEDSHTMCQVRPYVDAHLSRRLFGPGWKRDDLLTLVALQGNVSSKNRSAHDTRGNGTVDLIEFFQRVHGECAADENANVAMSLISGATLIVFDGKYSMQSNSDGVKIIAFNNENDLRKIPDKNCVKRLKKIDFPGTIISLKFPLSVTESTIPTECANEQKDD